ncbi:hypothetical protein Tco_1442967 [Tanacetum coccineum]
MICNMDSIGKYILEIILHQQQTPHLLKQKKLMQTQEDHSNPIQALNIDSLKVDLVVIQNTYSEKEDTNLETASSKSVKESSLDSATKDVHAIKYKMSKAKERCMTYFRSLHSHLQVVNYQFQKFIDLQFTLDYDSQITDKYFVEYTRIEVKHFRDTLLQHMGNVKKPIAERTQRSGTESEVQDDSSRSGNDTDAEDAENSYMTKSQWLRVDQYPEKCQVKSPMLDSSPDNQTTDYSKQSLESENILLKKTVA